MKAKEFMSANPITIHQDKIVHDAANMMVDKDISVLPVVDDNNKLVGIITQSDFIGKEVKIPHALASIKQLFSQTFYFEDIEEIYKKAKDKKLSQVMTKNIHVVDPEMHLSEVVKLMISEKLKRIPVVEGDKLVGIITRKDLVKAFIALEK